MELKMYCIVLRHLSPIQKGIQSAHAIVEYANTYSDSPNYKQWATRDKTLILLEVNTSLELASVFLRLKAFYYNVSKFKEPDLDNITTAISFLLTEEDIEKSEIMGIRNLKLAT